MGGVHGYSDKENKRRYQLHKVLKKKNIRCSAHSRTFFIPIGFEIESEKAAKELVSVFGCSAQTNVFSDESENRVAI
ncbi:hypothetical protein FCL53_17095 [Elizabethkingia meningoseptica]|uniref:hypothetical protein n=1 Tax=Elizabethkingia meningoseptica TaxID=238 RepID=UPI00136525D2|nr:hypothetical protein [Elizabethkingia meningoseptica]MVW93681.1 hypothetical protein [Elizabethkingia meningoseptica]